MMPQSDVPLAPLSTMGVGGPARWFVAARNESDIVAALNWANDRAVAVYVLGGGSNIVIADEGLDGLVIQAGVRGIGRATDGARVVYTVGAGEPWDPFVAATVDAGCAGLECLSGIPGCAGGTPVQNVGAYGQDVAGSITRVRAIDRRSGLVVTMTNEACGFGYRTSRFKRDDVDRYVVSEVEYALTPNGAPTLRYADLVAYFAHSSVTEPTLAEVRDAVLAVRRRKGMVIEPGNVANQSCGSFFVNPVVGVEDLQRVERIAAGTSVPHYVVDASAVKIPAAWLIEHAGFPKGTMRGPVGISPFQAQAIVNLGAARAADVVALAADVKRAVWNMFGISIVPEPVFVGFTSSPELRFLQTHQRRH
jgi:UDP-N-acetylmuramate dehydrogenase